jgi:hypothetical protein
MARDGRAVCVAILFAIMVGITNSPAATACDGPRGFAYDIGDKVTITTCNGNVTNGYAYSANGALLSEISRFWSAFTWGMDQWMQSIGTGSPWGDVVWGSGLWSGS